SQRSSGRKGQPEEAQASSEGVLPVRRGSFQSKVWSGCARLGAQSEGAWRKLGQTTGDRGSCCYAIGSAVSHPLVVRDVPSDRRPPCGLRFVASVRLAGATSLHVLGFSRVTVLPMSCA